MTSLPHVDDDPGRAQQLVLTTYRVLQGGKNQYRNAGGHTASKPNMKTSLLCFMFAEEIFRIHNVQRLPTNCNS